MTTVAGLIGVAAATLAGATIRLALTDPILAADALRDGEISSLVEQLAQVISSALMTLLQLL
jgi:hypothetical protein